jgi:3-hydroxybutyryl-CoA dehydrogenase
LNKELRRIGIVGAGAMGRGIAQICASAGHSVLLFDNGDGAVARAIEFVRHDLMVAVAKGKLAQNIANAALQRILPVDHIHEMGECDLIVEAVIENLQVKQQLLRDLESVVEPACVLATNTSSFSVTAIASGCANPDRVVGWHFFNPVPRMKLVEVIRALRTKPEVVDAMMSLSEQIGHRPIVVDDSPGFVVNHAGRAFVTEGLKLLAERAGDHQVIDAILQSCAGFRMGPFELLDLTGLDVSVPVMESIHAQFYGDDRYRPVALARTRLLAGLLGRKTGEGFYRYDGNSISKVLTSVDASKSQARSVWWPTEGFASLPQSLETLLGDCQRASDAESADVVLVSPLCRDLSSTIGEMHIDPRKAIAVDPMFAGTAGITLMVCPGTVGSTIDAARELFSAHSIPTFVIADSPGYVAPRMVACIVNLACEMAQQGIASPLDIDVAVRLGLGYPAGPFEWGDRLGAGRLLDVLKGLYSTFGDQRYRPSPWLVRRVQLSLPLSTPDRAVQP